jgi:tetratricopeptide (TPR) repeat protein
MRPQGPRARCGAASRSFNCLTVALIALCVVPLATPTARAECSSQVALAVTKACSLEATLEAVARGDGNGPPLAANTPLAGAKLFDATAGRPAVWSVEVLDGSRRRGFVLAADVTQLSRQLDNLERGERSLRSSFGQPATQPPHSIMSHENEQLREAWREATEAITANNALPAAQRLPDPYLARAEVYMQAGDVVAALDDCASASAIVATTGLDSRKQQQAAEIYTNAIKQLRSLPQPPRDAFTDIDMQASEHFNASQRFIAQRDFDKAISELAKALSLTPSQPQYWYMRAVARRESGDLHRAQSDALLGALFERRLSPPARHDVSKALTRIQGPTRLWLESYRRGKAEIELMALEL